MLYVWSKCPGFPFIIAASHQLTGPNTQRTVQNQRKRGPDQRKRGPDQRKRKKKRKQTESMTAPLSDHAAAASPNSLSASITRTDYAKPNPASIPSQSTFEIEPYIRPLGKMLTKNSRRLCAQSPESRCFLTHRGIRPITAKAKRPASRPIPRPNRPAH